MSPQEKARRACWKALLHTPGTDRLRKANPALVDNFRVDVFNYVVCQNEPEKSLYSFEVDHDYPASK